MYVCILWSEYKGCVQDIKRYLMALQQYTTMQPCWLLYGSDLYGTGRCILHEYSVCTIIKDSLRAREHCQENSESLSHN
jgi:hypothetical protein